MSEVQLYQILLILLVLTSVLPMLVNVVNSMRQKKQMKEQFEQRKAYLDALKVGDEVLLVSGIHGKIMNIKGSLVHLKIDNNVTIYVEKESIMGKARELLF